MCNPSNPNMGLLRIHEYEYRIPICQVTCCDMEKKDIEDLIKRVTQPIQATFQAKQLEIKVRDLTTQLTKLSRVVEKQQLKKG